jgi:hypothetical protein
MSYCRFSSDSDVYLYLSVHGWYGCCACGLADDVRLKTAKEAIDHLAEHVAAGDAVPESAFDRLLEEVEAT